MKNLNMQTFSPVFDLLLTIEGMGIEIEDFQDGIDTVDDEFQVCDGSDWRFIKRSEIDQIQVNELGSDPYILGCFNAIALADATDWPIELIEAAQAGGAYAELGQAVIDKGFVEELAAFYSSADGYGHHFATYDGHEHDVTIGDEEYLAFRTN